MESHTGANTFPDGSSVCIDQSGVQVSQKNYRNRANKSIDAIVKIINLKSQIEKDDY